MHGQHLCRASVAQPEVRGGLPQCLMLALPKPGLGLAPGSASTMRSASTRAWVTVRRGKSTMRAYGYVDDRLRRPAALPPLPEQARKAGKCSPSPTYPQAPQPTKDLILMK